MTPAFLLVNALANNSLATNEFLRKTEYIGKIRQEVRLTAAYFQSQFARIYASKI
jgi:hypothetical protein